MAKVEFSAWTESDDVQVFLDRCGDAVLKVYKKMDQTSSNRVRVEIQVELPEKKIEITESQFDEAYEAACDQYTISREILKQKLFGEKREG